jgi:nicotinamide-nucleotide amidase
MKAAIITIGDEILIGQITDTNSTFIAQQLNQLGIDIEYKMSLPDNQVKLVDRLSLLINEKIELIILTGGLGPTNDDITKLALCELTEDTLQINEEVLKHVKHFFAVRNRPMILQNELQAEVPTKSVILFNEMGTAPGLLMYHQSSMLIALPGVPFEMKYIFEKKVIPFILENNNSTQKIKHEYILTFGEGESFLAQRIAEIESSLPKHISLAYLPVPYAVQLRLTGFSLNEKLLDAELKYYKQQLIDTIGNEIVLSAFETPINQLVVDKLKQLNFKLGIAESCTGGELSSEITQISGASLVYNGGICSYSTALKMNLLNIPEQLIEEHDVVSEAVAGAMAINVAKLLNVQVGIGVTGILNVSDYYNSSIKTPTVCIGICIEEKIFTYTYALRHDRIQNKKTAAYISLCLLLKQLNQQYALSS